MKFSTRARYALRLMTILAKEQRGKPLGLGVIAKKTDISRRYLEQLAGALKAADLIRAVKGRGGGYELTRPAQEIRVDEIFDATIGPTNIVDCVAHPETCLKADICDCRPFYVHINDRITSVLHDVSLAQIADHSWLKKGDG